MANNTNFSVLENCFSRPPITMTSTSKKMEEIQLKEGKNSVAENASNYDKAKEVKAFDDTKAGVKGLVDAGVTKIPRFFIHPHGTVKSSQPEKGDVKAQLPLIDFKGFESCRRATIVAEILKALEEWGIFQVVNHGISGSVMEEMIAGIRGFHEQPQELKREWYSRDTDKKVRYVSNGNLLSSKAPADWRDSIAFDFQDGEIDSQLFPPVCRDAVNEYRRHTVKMGKSLAELVSEALGLPADYEQKNQA